MKVLAEIQLEKILATLDAQRPDVAVIDSIQTVYSEQLTSAPGSVAQVRECAAHLTRAAKASGTAIVLVGHVTKEGALAGVILKCVSRKKGTMPRGQVSSTFFCNSSQWSSATFRHTEHVIMPCASAKCSVLTEASSGTPVLMLFFVTWRSSSSTTVITPTSKEHIWLTRDFVCTDRMSITGL